MKVRQRDSDVDLSWPSTRVTFEYERTEPPAGGSPDPTRPRAHLYTSFGRESLTVLGARYGDCLVIRRERDYDDVDGETEDEKKQIYFSPGVGKVQEINVDSGNTEQLVSHSEVTAAHGCVNMTTGFVGKVVVSWWVRVHGGEV